MRTGRQSRRSVFSDGALLGIGSALAYIVAFVYEKAYCAYFGIPQTLISPSTSTILVSVVAIGTAFLSFFPMSGFTWVWIARLVRREERYRPFGKLIFLNVLLVTALFYAGTVVGFADVIGFWLAVCLTMNGWVITRAVWRHRKMPDLRSRFEAAHKADMETETAEDVLIDSIGLERVLAVFFAVVLLMLAWITGHGNAARQNEFFLLSEYPGYALLRSYGDVVVAVKINTEQKLFEDQTIVLRAGQTEKLTLSRVSAGPLRRAKPK